MTPEAAAPVGEPSPDHRRHLARLCAGAYLLVVLLASLYPFSGWRDPGAGMFAYLATPWSTFHTPGDVELNVLGYLPLGVLLVLSLESLGRAPAVACAVLAPGLLSVLLEGLQTYLPSRVPSQLDVIANVGGAALGAALTVAGPLRERHRVPLRLRARWFRPGPVADTGLILLALWLFTQLNPEVSLFATGDLGHLLGLLPPWPYDGPLYFRLSAAVTALNLAAALHLLGLLQRADAPRLPPALALVGVALLVKSLAGFALFARGGATLWLTWGAALGLTLGVCVAVLLRRLPRPGAIAAGALLVGGALLTVNAMPDNPYLQLSAQALQHGHFASFRAVTRLVAGLWPLLALALLAALAAEPAADGPPPAD